MRLPIALTAAVQTAAALTLAACASRPEPVAVVVPVAPPPVVATLPMPQPPAGAAPNLALPARLADGGWATPNRDVSSAAAAWHVRSALNVAALGCRDAEEAATVAAYNALLRNNRAVLARVDADLRAEYRTRHGGAWQDAHDDRMTKVYNFFAQPPVHAAFCTTARAVLAEVSAMSPDAFVAAAPAALARLEAPFLAFYDAYAGYRDSLLRWQTARAPAPAPHLTVAASVIGADTRVVSPD